jgi:hypothetical protein
MLKMTAMDEFATTKICYEAVVGCRCVVVLVVGGGLMLMLVPLVSPVPLLSSPTLITLIMRNTLVPPRLADGVCGYKGVAFKTDAGVVTATIPNASIA